MLSAKDWSELDKIIIQLHEVKNGEAFKNFVLGPLVDFLGALFASWNIHNDQMYLVEVANSPNFEERILPLLPTLNQTLPTHPLFANFMDFKTGKVRVVDTVERTRDHVSTSDYHQLPFYKQVASKVGVEDQLLMHISVKNGMGVLLTFHSDREFTEKEQLKASIMRGHILARHHTLQAQSEQMSIECRSIQSQLEAKLTGREIEVMRLLCRGISNGEIARELSVSTKTIDKHVSNLLKKLEISCRTKVIARYAAWVK